MCGRTCLTLEPEEIRCACKYISSATGNNNKNLNANNKKAAAVAEEKDENASNEVLESETSVEKPKEVDDDVEIIIPEWRKEYNAGLEYKPCYNIAPQSVTPVLVSSRHFEGNNAGNEGKHSQVLVPMLWGMIPFWHKGDYKKHGLTTNNCRLEHMLESKLYEKPYRRGQRCVIVCEGFYEWQTTKSSKPSERDAYLLYMPQNEGVSIWNKKTWSPDDVNLLKLAGLFDVWTDEDGDKIYSYSVITFESNQTMSWLHHRMPAILETDQQVDDWLDFKRVNDKEAIKVLRPATSLKWHRVSKVVNNSRNTQADCNKPLEVLNSKSNGANTLKSWLQARKRREEELNINYDSETDEESLDNSTSSDNDSSNSRSKKPRFRDFKKSKQQKMNSTASADSGSV